MLALGTAAAAAVTLALSACTTGSNAVDQSAGGNFRFVHGTPSGKTIPAPDRKAPGHVTGDKIGGGTFALQELRGKVVVLNFWATWCGPCQVETPELSSFYREQDKNRVAFVGLDVKDSRPAVESFVTDNKISYPIVFDEAARTALQLGRVPMTALPSTVVVDKQGRVAAVYVGAVQPADLQPALTALAKER